MTMLALALLGAALTGCGEDTKGSTGSVTLTGRQPVAIEGFEYGFRPGSITFRTGGESARVRFDLTNEGSLPHDVHVRRGDESLGGTDAVGGGKKASATVNLAPGDYEVYCSIGDHADLGMKADLKIE
jgi:plastocyanin